MAVFWVLKFRGAILLGTLAGLGVALFSGVSKYEGLVSLPPSVAPTLLAFDFALPSRSFLDLVAVGFVLLFLDIFDTVGTLLGVA